MKDFLPIYLPLWIVRRLPVWWRARRLARIMRELFPEDDIVS